MHSLNFSLKRNIPEISLILFIGLCSAYTTQITNLSPYYFGYFFAVLFLILYDLKNLKIANIRRIKILFFVFATTFFYQILNAYITATEKFIFGNTVLLCINQLSTIITYQICKHISNEEKSLKESFDFFSKVAFFLGICDFFYRLVHSSRNYSGIQFFYNFKLHALMFTDSNWTGFIYMIIFAFFVYLRDFTNFIKKKQIIAMFIVILLSFSRAAFFSSILVICYSKFNKLSKSKKRFISVLLLFFIITSAAGFIKFLSYDDSFGTKLALLKGFKYYFNHINFKTLLIGNGTLSSSTDMSLLGNVGYSAHLYLIIKTLDLGLIGIILDFGYLLIICHLSRGKFFYILLPFIICSLSMYPTNLSMMYVFGGVMIFIEETRRKTNGLNFSNNAGLQR